MPRLLVVEDDADVRDLIALRLVQAGHQVVPTAHADAARRVVDTLGAPDAYVLDIGLPGVDGFELLRQLREVADPHIPAVFLSARTGPDDIARGLGLGAAFVTKPFRTGLLLEVLDDVLAERSRPDPWPDPGPALAERQA
jgi:DNA-binding response OmpR family regulator